MKTSLKERFITNENLNDNWFYNSLAEELNQIIEEELNKNYEDINAELIDDCCLALSSIYELQGGEVKNTEAVKNINAVIKKYKLQKRQKIAVAAACAAIAVFTVGVTTVTVGKDRTVIESGILKSAIGKIEELFEGRKPDTGNTTEQPGVELTEQPTAVETTTQVAEQQFTEAVSTTEKIRTIKNITVIAPQEFNASVSSRDEISLRNFCISVNYTDGEKTVVPISVGSYEIGETKQDGFTEIKVYYEGFSTSVYVTVLPEEESDPVIVTSIYGTFANEYTVEDMSVIAVFSDGTEREIPKSDCTITTEEFTDGDEAGVVVTVAYGNCSFCFLRE